MRDVTLNGVSYSTLAYADDIALFASSEADMNHNLGVLCGELANLNLNINIGKTEYMVINPCQSDNKDSAEGYKKRMESVKRGRDAEYLDTEMSADLDMLFVPSEFYDNKQAYNLACPDSECPFIAYSQTCTGKNASAAEALRSHIAKRHNHSIDTTLGQIRNLYRRSIWVYHAKNATARKAQGAGHAFNIHIGTHILKRVTHFKYLGSIVTDTGCMEKELARRAGQATGASIALERAWKHIRGTKVRARLFRTLIIPTLLYGCETWSLTKQEEAKLEAKYHALARRALHMRILPRRQRWTGPTNEKVSEIGRLPKIHDLIRQARLRLFGQMYRNSSSAMLMAIRDSTGKNEKRGGMRTSWKAAIQKDVAELGLTPDQADNKEKWAKAIQPNIIGTA